MPTRRAGPRLLGAGAMVCLVLAGCGSDLKTNDAVGRLPPPGTEAPAGAGTPTVPPPGTGSPVRPGPRPLTPGPGSAAPSAFCRDLADVQGLIAVLLQPGGTATAATQAQALVQRLGNDAPAELRPAITALVRVEARVLADLSANPPNSADLAAALADPGYQQALRRVAVYANQHCSLSLTLPVP